MLVNGSLTGRFLSQVVPRRYQALPNRSALFACSINLTICDLGHTVTVFGATGFLGRYIVNRLGMSTCCQQGKGEADNPSSFAGMHGRCSLPRGDGEETPETHW